MTETGIELELIREWGWRLSEINSLANLIGDKDDEASMARRKAAIVMLYAHFEGFCILALQSYRIHINQNKVKAAGAKPAVVAGAWGHVFAAMQTGDAKCKVFGKPMQDEELHVYWRRRSFIEEHLELFAKEVKIPEKIISSDSNLSAYVLKRNLFVLGLDHTWVAELPEGGVDRLKNTRNAYAHGERAGGVYQVEYKEFFDLVQMVVAKLKEVINSAAANSHFLLDSVVGGHTGQAMEP